MSSTWVRLCNAGGTGPYCWRLNTALALACHVPEQRLHAAEDLQVSFMLEKKTCYSSHCSG